MWQIQPAEILLLRTPGGDRFTLFVDTLIRAQVFADGGPDRSVSTNLRTTIADGGVDTQVDTALAEDPTGRLVRPSCWQYKARGYSGISDTNLREEIHKSYASRLIGEGHSYRLCICDDMPPPTKAHWKETLESEYRQLSGAEPSGDDVDVVTSSDLAAWASRFPAITLQYFRQRGAPAFHLATWGTTIRSLTPDYVSVPVWEEASSLLARHVDLRVPCDSPVMTVQGEAGVGKTRLVYEVLAGIPALAGLVVYTPNDKMAEQLAIEILNNPETAAILVADECSPEYHLRLLEACRGQTGRIRVVTIQNLGDRRSGQAPLWLSHMPEQLVDEILTVNIPDLPPDRRRACVGLSGGFVRLAVDLARHGGRIDALQDLGAYIKTRLSERELDAARLVSLFTKLGFREDVVGEFGDACTLVGIDPSEALRASATIKDVPGFIAHAGRFMYVTPQGIAYWLFDGAWNAWFATDPDRLLSQLKSPLLDRFLEQVSRVGREEVRRHVGGYFLGWARQLSPDHLQDVESVLRLKSLTEAAPEEYLPTLQDVIEGASEEQLLAIAGHSPQHDWGPRRHLVWMCEELTGLSGTFHSLESILYRLASTETEPGIGNNATSIWNQLFRIALSGTLLPFRRRCEVLEARLQAASKIDADLVTGALSEIFTAPLVRRVIPASIRRYSEPPEWFPPTREEYLECLNCAVALLELTTRNPSTAPQAYQIALQNTRSLLSRGFLDALREKMAPSILAAGLSGHLVQEVENYLDLDDLDAGLGLDSDAYRDRVRSWLSDISPQNTMILLQQEVGKDPWHYSRHERGKDRERWIAALRTIAEELCSSPSLLKAVLEWLCSPAARSAELFGAILGESDSTAVCLRPMIEVAEGTRETALLRGYVGAIVNKHSPLAGTVNAALDSLETTAPDLALQIGMSGGQLTHGVERAVRLLSGGRVSEGHVQGLVAGIWGMQLSSDQALAVMRLLRTGLEQDSEAYERVADNFFMLIAGVEEPAIPLDVAEVREELWALLSEAADRDHMQGHWWAATLESFLQEETSRVVHVASKGLRSVRSIADTTKKILNDAIGLSPELVMETLGSELLDPATGWRVALGHLRDLISAIPPATVKEWLQRVGADGARAIARHLPSPYLSPDGAPIVPELTEFVLEEYESDDEILRNFCAGLHSLQLYSGDIAAAHEKEAAIARRFLTHRLPRVRQWAEQEIRSAEETARHMRRIQEERLL